MPRIVQYGKSTYYQYTVLELESLGLRENRNMWTGPGTRFCIACNKHGYTIAYSHPGQSDCFEVCRECRQHHHANEIK